jgi:hypothetical protein
LIAPVCFNIRVAHAIAGVERDFDHAVDVKKPGRRVLWLDE